MGYHQQTEQTEKSECYSMGFGTGAHPQSTDKKKRRPIELQGSLEKRKLKLEVAQELRTKSVAKPFAVERQMVMEASIVDNLRLAEEDLGLNYNELTPSSKLQTSHYKQ